MTPATRGQPVVSVRGLAKYYGELAAVDEVSFDVDAGTVVALLGPNGAGKTTTVEILQGYTGPDAGTVRVLGMDPLRADRRWRSRIGAVPQSTHLDPPLTVQEVLRVFAAAFPDPLPIGAVLETVDLVAEAGVRISALSGGQLRRVDVGLAVLGRPELLFLDEPTTGFDPAARRQMWATIERLAANGTTVLLTTHYLDEASRLADRVVVLASGRIVADAAPDDLRRRCGGSTVRLPLPAAIRTAELPPHLRRYHQPERSELVARTSEVAEVLGEILGWGQATGLDVTALEVGPPSLEDAYLTITGASPSETESATHA
ncbi:MAG TPA: ABC transporter ATP-binding protein [Jatrophihabitans sp.]|nr:ABC transporter ATP-binding protein [Jatrophihabitans sp.]